MTSLEREEHQKKMEAEAKKARTYDPHASGRDFGANLAQVMKSAGNTEAPEVPIIHWIVENWGTTLVTLPEMVAKLREYRDNGNIELGARKVMIANLNLLLAKADVEIVTYRTQADNYRAQLIHGLQERERACNDMRHYKKGMDAALGESAAFSQDRDRLEDINAELGRKINELTKKLEAMPSGGQTAPKVVNIEVKYFWGVNDIVNAILRAANEFKADKINVIREKSDPEKAYESIQALNKAAANLGYTIPGSPSNTLYQDQVRLNGKLHSDIEMLTTLNDRLTAENKAIALHRDHLQNRLGEYMHENAQLSQNILDLRGKLNSFYNLANTIDK